MGRDTLTACLNNTVLHPGTHAFIFCGLILCHWKEMYRVCAHHSRPWPCFIQRAEMMCLGAKVCEIEKTSTGWPTRGRVLCILRIQWKLRCALSRGWNVTFSPRSTKSFCGDGESESAREEETGGEAECVGSQASGSTHRMSVVNVHTAGHESSHMRARTHTRWNVNSLVNSHKRAADR